MDLSGLKRRLTQPAGAPYGSRGDENVILDGEMVGRLREAAAGVFEVADVSVPRRAQQGVVVFTGRLLSSDPDAGYDELARRWTRLGYTPLLRAAGGAQQLVANPGLVKPRPSNVWINVALFAATVLSVVFMGALNEGIDPLSDPAGLARGLPFAATLLAILGAHEFGHYFAARHHKVAVTLPYFIPMPLSFVGTFGAFIQLRSPVRNRNHLFDVGVAGPLVGLAVALPLLVYGLAISPVQPLPSEGGYMMEGNSLLYLGIKYLIHDELLPANGRDVMLDPVAFAAWFGLLVTAFNLLPVGQLDGGHVLFALFGERVRVVGMVFVGILIVMGIVLWEGWLVWAMLTFLLGVAHPPPLNDLTPLDPRRRVLGMVVLLIFVLVFVPVPLTVVM
jgi:membrane-associated protease RseP (regulator of RpoE activity)